MKSGYSVCSLIYKTDLWDSYLGLSVVRSLAMAGNSASQFLGKDSSVSWMFFLPVAFQETLLVHEHLVGTGGLESLVFALQSAGKILLWTFSLWTAGSCLKPWGVWWTLRQNHCNIVFWLLLQVWHCMEVQRQCSCWSCQKLPAFIQSIVH